MLARDGIVGAGALHRDVARSLREERHPGRLERFLDLLRHLTHQQLRREDRLLRHAVDGALPLHIAERRDRDRDLVGRRARALDPGLYASGLDLDADYLSAASVGAPALQAIAPAEGLQHPDPAFRPPGAGEGTTCLFRLDAVLDLTRP